MARSDNTAWCEAPDGTRGLMRKWTSRSMPAGTGRYLRRKWNKQQRHAERIALARQLEPEPVRPRHGVGRDCW